MKVAIGMKITNGPFGGGNQFGKALASYLVAHGHEVFFDLERSDLDIILLTDPRSYLSSVSFGPIEIAWYIKQKNAQPLILHRINECDERKGTKTTNRELALANSLADHTIYIASWLIDLFEKQQLHFSKQYSVIKNGADSSVFLFEKKIRDPQKKIKLVTHHWAVNIMKGWDVYSAIDALLDQQEFRSKFEFHYIGNVPKTLSVKNTILHKPCVGTELASRLKACDIYVTASLNEPAGMHHIEGALCGLPLLYRNSGALPEYCEGFGVMFEGVEDFSLKLKQLVDSFDVYAEQMRSYDHTSEKMCKEYVALFERLLAQKQNILQQRSHYRFTWMNIFFMKCIFFYYHFLVKCERMHIYV